MTYRIAREDHEDSPWPVFERVIGYPELDAQASLFGYGIRWGFVFRDEEKWTQHGRSILGTACMPGVNGALSGLFEQLLEDAFGYWPDFLITLNAGWWAMASDREREILVFHELKHCDQAKDPFGAPKFSRTTGMPVITIVGHDVEEFNDVVARYGAWKGDLAAFLEAAASGPQTPNSAVSGDDLAAVLEAESTKSPDLGPVSTQDAEHAGENVVDQPRAADVF